MALNSTDPVCFARDEDGHVVFPLRLVSGLEAVAIGIRTRVKLAAGEWFLDLDAGMPWLPTADGTITEREALLGQTFNPAKMRAALIDEIFSVPAVIDVPQLRMSFDGETRMLSISLVARTLFGDVQTDIMQRTF